MKFSKIKIVAVLGVGASLALSSVSTTAFAASAVIPTVQTQLVNESNATGYIFSKRFDAYIYPKFPTFFPNGLIWVSKNKVINSDKLKPYRDSNLLSTNNEFRILKAKRVLVIKSKNQTYYNTYNQVESLDGKIKGWTLSTNLKPIKILDSIFNFENNVDMKLKPKYQKQNHFYVAPQGTSVHSMHPVKLSKHLNKLHFRLNRGVLRTLESDNWYQINSTNPKLNGKWVSGGVIESVNPQQNSGVSEF